MMYATLLAQAAIIASLALFAGPSSTYHSTDRPPVFAAGAIAAHDKTKLRCRLYFGCTPAASAAIGPSLD